MVSYKVGLCHMGGGGLEPPYDGISIDARNENDAVEKGKQWAALTEVTDNSRLLALLDGRCVASHLESKFATYRRALEASKGERLWRKRV